MSELSAPVAIIGGSGFYDLFDPAADNFVGLVAAQTPFGEPSAPISIAEIAGLNVAFLPRHGLRHEYPPHSVPYRANIHALAELGVKRILAPCASGSMNIDLAPGSLVVPDQLIDQTKNRPQTFYDMFDGQTHHAKFAEPYCAPLRESILKSAADSGWTATDGATMVVIDGPRFSTRAESRFYEGQGWDLVNMTGHPEAVLAREKGICYATLALVTNYSGNLTTGAGVSDAEVFEFFAANIERLRKVLLTAVEPARLPIASGCCS